MKLSDLLEDAPPARYTVDDFVAAGRRRRRRRNAGWAIAAVTAVAVAIGVPQILTRHDPDPLPATPTPVPRPLNYLFKTYPVPGDSGRLGLTVGDPEWVGVNNQNAYIARATPRNRMPHRVGSLTVFNAGFDASRNWSDATVTRTDPIDGRPAFFAVPRKPRTNEPEKPDKMLVWQYDSGATAMITSYNQRLSRDEMIRAAERFAVSVRPVRQMFTISWVPPDLRLVAVENGEDGEWSALFAPAGRSAGYEVTARGSRTDWLLSSMYYQDDRWLDGAEVPANMVEMRVWMASSSEVGSTPRCQEAGEDGIVLVDQAPHCVVSLAERTMLTVRGADTRPVADLRRIAEATKATGRLDTGGPGWTDATESFPTSAQLPRD